MKGLDKYGKRNALRLKKLGIFAPFMKEAKKRFGSLDNPKFLCAFNGSEYDIINYSLIWDETSQGWEFWNEKNDLFNEMDLKKYSK